jgi:predicted MFS family arabinose efflux permease
VIEAPTRGWGSTPILLGFVVGTGMLAAFITWELHTTHPMLQMQFFENRRFTVASAAITLTFFSLFGMLFILTQYLQVVLGFSAVKAWALLLPQGAVMLVFAPLSSVWVGRFGNKRVVAGGLVIVAASLLAIASVNENTAALVVVGLTALMGLGMANVMAPATDSIMGSLPRAKAGVGSAVNDTTRQAGGAVGVAVLGSVLASRYHTQVVHLLGKGFPLLAAVRDNVAAAKGFAVANPAAQPVRAQIVHAANASFVSGMHIAATLAAATILLTALMVALLLPARATEAADERRADAEVPVAVEAAAAG